MKTRLAIIGMILILEALQLGYSDTFSSNLDEYYSFTSRYSARISFAILITTSIWILFRGLPFIFRTSLSRDVFLGALTGFTINHLIHFYCLAMNFEIIGLDIWTKVISFGAAAYVILTIAPLYFWRIKKLERKDYFLTYGFIILMLLICIFTYSTRLVGVSELPLPPSDEFFMTLIVIATITVIGLLVRLFRFDLLED